jgi:lipopolysaccharide assembly outer membrane protein LptD (OstA)
LIRQPRPATLITLFLAWAAACAAQQVEPWRIHGLDGQSQFESRDNTNYFTHGVLASNETTLITAEQAAANDLNGSVLAEGDVTILDHGHIWRGTNLVYNFKTGEVRAGFFKTVQTPFSMSGEKLSGNSNMVFTATNASISTEDYERPATRFRARRITIVPGAYIEAWDATYYVGQVPIFYWPHYKRTLGQHQENWQFAPGYRSLFGPYLLTTYNWYGNGLLDGSLHFDEREKRGQAGGPDLSLHAGKWGRLQLLLRPRSGCAGGRHSRAPPEGGSPAPDFLLQPAPELERHRQCRGQLPE